MSFIYSCIGDNSPENREHLEKLGIKGYSGYHQFIIVHNGHYFGTDEYMKVHYPCVGCVDNSLLFQAITAMREDSDYMQWFVREESESDIILETDNIDNWVLCEINNFQEFGEYFGVYHKATLAELEEHFK